MILPAALSEPHAVEIAVRNTTRLGVVQSLIDCALEVYSKGEYGHRDADLVDSFEVFVPAYLTHVIDHDDFYFSVAEIPTGECVFCDMRGMDDESC